MERVTWSKVIWFYMVVWNNHSEQDSTWEQDDYLRELYPAFYEEWLVFQISGQDFYKGRGCNTLVLSFAFDICIL